MMTIGDRAHASLRSLVEVVDRELGAINATDSLRTAWADMVKVLALGPPPELRECPACGGIGMRAASRCGQCWASLAPLPLPPNE